MTAVYLAGLTMRGRAVAARRAHNPEVLGSNPSPATTTKALERVLFRLEILVRIPAGGTMSKPRYYHEGTRESAFSFKNLGSNPSEGLPKNEGAISNTLRVRREFCYPKCILRVG